jgi:hypothetical protein
MRLHLAPSAENLKLAWCRCRTMPGGVGGTCRVRSSKNNPRLTCDLGVVTTIEVRSPHILPICNPSPGTQNKLSRDRGGRFWGRVVVLLSITCFGLAVNGLCRQTGLLELITGYAGQRSPARADFQAGKSAGHRTCPQGHEISRASALSEGAAFVFSAPPLGRQMSNFRGMCCAELRIRSLALTRRCKPPFEYKTTRCPRSQLKFLIYATINRSQ